MKKYKNEVDIGEIFLVLGDYKWLILLVMLLSLVASSIYLYFTPSVYSTHSIVEVKTYEKGNLATDDLLQNAFYSTKKDVDKEIELLKTFAINEQVLNKVNLRSQIFVENGYKSMEKYGKDAPIKIEDLKILDQHIVGKKIRLVPHPHGYALRIKQSSLKSMIKKEELKLNDQKIYPYGEEIETPYFRITIKKQKTITQPLYFVLNGDNYTTYENIVQRKLTVQQLKKQASLIVIKYEDTIVDRGVEYVNSLVHIFLENGLQKKRDRNRNILDFIYKQLEERKKKLDESENELRAFKVKNRIVSKSVQTDTMIANLSKVDFEILENQLKKSLVENILATLRRGDDVESIASSLSELGDDATIEYIMTLSKLKEEERTLEPHYTDEYPKLIAVRQQIASTQERIVQNIKNLQRAIDNRLEGLKKIKNRYDRNLLKLPEEEITLIKLTSKYQLNFKMYDYLLKKKDENEMIKVATIPDYEVIENAYPRRHPIKPNRTLIMLSSLIVGLILGGVIALILSALRNKIKTLKDIESETDLNIHGVIPFYKEWKNRKIWVYENPQSLLSDSFRKLRTDLDLLYPEKKSKIILLSSMDSKEGKSTVAVNLGAILQLSGYRVLMIDLNLKTPLLHHYFDIDAEVGISEYLNGIENLADVIYSTLYPNLDIIPAGSSLANPAELLLSNKLEKIFIHLKEQYDYIIVDSGSIGTSIDTLSLMKYTDINLVLFRVNRAQKAYVNKLEKMIDKYHLKNIGIVVNSVKNSDIKNKF